MFVSLHEGWELSTVVKVLGVGAKHLQGRNGNGGWQRLNTPATGQVEAIVLCNGLLSMRGIVRQPLVSWRLLYCVVVWWL